MRKTAGFTLIELLVVLAIALILFTGITTFFLTSFENFDVLIKTNKGLNSLFNAMAILEMDIRKSGYGFNNTNGSLEWDPDSFTLTLKFVDYQKEGCEEKSWGEEKDCDYVVKYVWKKKNLLRMVDKGADGTFFSAYMFDGILVKIEKFKVENNACRVFIYLEADIKEKKHVYQTYVKRQNCIP